MQLENKFSVRPISSAAAATIETLRQQSDACTQRVTHKAALNDDALQNHTLGESEASNLHPYIIEALVRPSKKAYHMLQGAKTLWCIGNAWLMLVSLYQLTARDRKTCMAQL